MSVLTSYGIGYSASAPSEAQTFMRRRGYLPDATRTGIVYCHSWGATAATGPFPTSTISTAVPGILRHLTECGWPILAADLAGDTFGNDTGTARVEDARTYLQAAAQGAKTGKVILVGWSEGGVTAMAHAKAHLGNVAAMVLLQPASDLQDVVTNNRDGAAAAVNAAYSGGYSDATYGANHNPVIFASSLAGTPTLVYYSSDDTVIIPSTVQTVLAGIGSSASVGAILTGNHGDGSLSKIDPQQIARWLSDQGL